MKLFLETAFRWNTPCPLTDGAGRIRYTLVGDAFHLRRKLRVLDLAGREAVGLCQVLPGFPPRYEAEVYGKPLGEILKDLTVRPACCLFPARNWRAEGPLGAASVSVWEGSAPVASLQVSGRQTVLDLPEDDSALPALGFLLLIRCIFADQEPRRL